MAEVELEGQAVRRAALHDPGYQRRCVVTLWFGRRGDADRPCASGRLPRRAAPETRARGTPDTRCVRSLMRNAKNARVSHYERTETSGIPHAVRPTACFVLSPAAIDTLAFVTDGTKQCGRERPDLVSCGRSACRRSVPLRQRRASGPHDSGQRAKAMQMGSISAQARTAMCRRLRARSSAPEAPRPGPADLLPRGPLPPSSAPRPPRPPHLAPRQVTIASRPSGGGIDRNISNHQDLVKRPTSDLLTIEDRL